MDFLIAGDEETGMMMRRKSLACGWVGWWVVRWTATVGFPRANVCSCSSWENSRFTHPTARHLHDDQHGHDDNDDQDDQDEDEC